VQNARKERGLEVSDRIKLRLFGPDKLKAAWEAFAEYVAAETLAISVEWAGVDGMLEIEAGDEKWLVQIEKA
jgi:isoleucyl-tRNA synthetase